MKKIFITIIIFLLVLSTTACAKKTTKKELTDAEKFKAEYESINDKDNGHGNKNRKINIPANNPIIYTTAEDLVEKMNKKESFIVYFGFNKCPWCRSVIEELINAANDKAVDKIYYVDVLDIRDTMKVENNEAVTDKKGTDAYYQLLEKMDNVLDKYSLKDEDGNEIETNEKRIYAPNVVAVSDGKAIQLETGISEKQTDGFQELTDDMKKESYNKFECLITCLEEAATTCQKNMC